MPDAVRAKVGWTSLLLPGALLVGVAGAFGAQSGMMSLPVAWSGTAVDLPPTVIVPAQVFSYRLDGDYQRAGKAVDPPLVTGPHDAVEVMTYQVSAADYARCVADAACEPAEPRRQGEGNVPVTGVNFTDAESYAAWLSRRSGSHWRLPTIEEWTFVAGSKASDPALGVDSDNPADRWIAFYEKQAALGQNALATPKPLGSYGTNEFGVADLAETVWEWTSTCDSRTSFDAAGAQVSQLQSCGVRLLEGRHRTAMSFFVRDSVAGGCSAGAPPDNLGFRLVREPGWIEGAGSGIGEWLSALSKHWGFPS